MNFIGEHSCKVDLKGRVLFPSAFKKQIKESAEMKFVVKKDIFENCLVLFHIEEWENQAEHIKSKINPYNKEHNQFLRIFHKGKVEITLDSASRILLPKYLIELVGINKEIIMAGQDNKIEIWSKAKYLKLGADEKEFMELAEKIMN